MCSRFTLPPFLSHFVTGIAGVIDRGDQKLPLLQILKKVAVDVDFSRRKRQGQLLRRGTVPGSSGSHCCVATASSCQLRAELLLLDDAQHIGGHAGVKSIASDSAAARYPSRSLDRLQQLRDGDFGGGCLRFVLTHVLSHSSINSRISSSASERLRATAARSTSPLPLCHSAPMAWQTKPQLSAANISQ